VDDLLKHFYRNIIRPEVIDQRKVLYGVTAALAVLLVGLGVGAVLYDPRLWLFDILLALTFLEAQLKESPEISSDRSRSRRGSWLAPPASDTSEEELRQVPSDASGLPAERPLRKEGGKGINFRLWWVMMLSPFIFPNLVLVAQNWLKGENLEGSLGAIAVSVCFFCIGWFGAPTSLHGHDVSTNPRTQDWLFAGVVLLMSLAMCCVFQWPDEVDALLFK